MGSRKGLKLCLVLGMIILCAIPVEDMYRSHMERLILLERLIELSPQQFASTRQAMLHVDLDQSAFMRILLTVRKAQMTNHADDVERLLEWWSINYPRETIIARTVMAGGVISPDSFSLAGNGTQTIQRRLTINEISGVALKIMLCLAAFLIAFGLSSFFIRDIFPWKKEKPQFSNALSYSTSFLLSAVFALWLFTANAGQEFVKSITQGFSRVVSTVLAIMFVSIGVYLFWKKIKAWIKPG